MRIYLELVEIAHALESDGFSERDKERLAFGFGHWGVGHTSDFELQMCARHPLALSSSGACFVAGNWRCIAEAARKAADAFDEPEWRPPLGTLRDRSVYELTLRLRP
jgi:hypothetical protein